jgi:hypothetical protein
MVAAAAFSAHQLTIHAALDAAHLLSKRRD